MSAIKRCLNDLAIFGGASVFQGELHVGRPNIGNRVRFLARINEVLDRRWLTNHGPFAQEFEQRIADLVGVKHCIATCNGTVALEIAIRASGLTGEVIVPSFTFIATAHALQWQAITPVFCDIDRHTCNIDPGLVEKLITRHTTGIIGVHLWGRACNVKALAEIARRHHLKLLFDAAHAFGCTYEGRMIGGFGDVEVFSFHATKFLNTFEGGAVTTNDDELASKIRLMSNFGFAGYDNVVYIGTNGKFNEVSAAMGLTGLESLDDFVAANCRNYAQYQRELAGLPGIQLIAYSNTEKSNYQYVILEIDEQTAGLDRDILVEILHAEHVLARRYFYPGCHKMEPYRSFLQNIAVELPETDRLVRRVLALPTGTAIGPDGIHAICQVIRFVVGHASEVRAQLAWLASGGR